MKRKTVSASVATATSSVAVWTRQHPAARSCRRTRSPSSSPSPTRDRSAPAALPACASAACEHIIGVSVSETTADIRMVTVSVTANSRNSRPTMSPMNSSGISTAISEMVSEMIVNPICSAPFSAASQRILALFDVADDVLDHHDGVVHHEAGGNGQRHQRQIVQAVAQQIHHAERAHQRQRHRDAGNDGGAKDCAETERSPSPPGRWSASARTPRRSPKRGWWWCGRSGCSPGRTSGSVAVSCGSSFLMRSTTEMMLAPGCR